MQVRVLGFATVGEILGSGEVTIELAEKARLEDLKEALIERYPPLAMLWTRLAVAVNGELAKGDPPLADGVEVALLPPVSGGSSSPTALVDGPIDVAAVTASVTAASCGAVLVFVGTVRSPSRGRAVDRLRYDAYRPLAERTLERIVAETETAHEGTRLAVVHRLGEVPAGEASVVIAVASPHRDLAYETSRRTLERLKREVPIWKREHFADGDAAWREDVPLVARPSPS